MNTNHNATAPRRTMNIVISGTNFWNPGDDFVRDGVIRVLRELFPGVALNFLFYNFNADFFPQTKFSGIGNYVSRGDLDQFRDSVDAVIIAGLSAGDEIKDLYRWIIENGLQDRVYLIGAGYENEYVAQHVSKEPEATIFKSARIITGRTAKTPEFLRKIGTPYAHVNCPAILSVPEARTIPAGRKIERIGFSIQLPHGQGLVNHSCAAKQSQLAVDMLLELSKRFAVEVVAHHKSEYFHFLKALRGTSIPVLFSSFYQNLFEIYPRYDLVVTTRLHSSLFANGHGIPGIIINDTDRHTHTLDGFPHSVWVNSRQKFDKAFARVQQQDLRKIAEEAAAFKRDLLRRYVEVLSGPFGIKCSSPSMERGCVVLDQPQHAVSAPIPSDVQHAAAGLRHSRAPLPADYHFNSEFKEQKLVRSLVKPGMTVFDVGAHAGKYTKLFSLLVGETGRVIAFEPTPDSARRIAAEITDAGLKNVALLQNAVAERNGRVTLHQFPEEYSSWNGLGRPHMEDPKNQGQFVPIVGSVDVDAITLDTFCRDQRIDRIDYLKLDVEGAEIRALQGARGLLERKAIGLLQFEISRKMLEGLNTTARPVFDYLASQGYECRVITEDGRIGPKASDSSAFYENYIAMPAATVANGARPSPGAAGTTQLGASNGSNAVRHSSIPASEDGRTPSDLPIHFFTIVLNGKPFIEHHIKAFEQLPFRWHWHIIEGVAELNHDTAWSKTTGGRIAPEVHRNGLSRDGTTEYLDELVEKFPDNVTLYRKPGGAFWDGKLEMVNAPLANLREECLLWQVDGDELWTAGQLITARNLFLAHSDKTAAFYFCHYFVGEKLVITTRETYGNNTGYEWIRTWRFTPGCRWLAHEPPRLCRPAGNGKWADLASINPLRHAETEAAGLVFQHFAYATLEQLEFKETYYGYAGALRQWKKLQQQHQFPVALSKHFDWVKDAAQVNTAESQRVTPLVVKDKSGVWSFSANASTNGVQRILFVRTDAIGDAVIAAPMLPHIRARYPGAKIAVLCREHVADLYLACPFVDTVICFDWQKVKDNEQARREILLELVQFQPDLILNSLYSRESVTEVLIHALEAPQVIGLEGNLSNISARDRAEFNTLYTRLLPSPGETKPELERHRDFLVGLGIVADKLDPQVWTAPEDDALAEAFFKEQQLDPAKTIALFPGAQHDWKVYPHFAEALKDLAGHRFLIFGGAEVAGDADKLVAQLPAPSVNLCGKTTLREMAALFRKCRLYVGADSAGAHIACAVGLPNVVVLGGGHFGRFLPYSPLTSVACLPLECYGCNWACKFETVHCVKSLAPEVVTEAIRQTLAVKSARPRVFAQDSSSWPARANAPHWKNVGRFLGRGDVEIIAVSSGSGGVRPSPGAEADNGQVSKQSSSGRRTSDVSAPGDGRTANRQSAILNQQSLTADLTRIVSGPEPRQRVLNIISCLEKDHWLERNLKMYADTTTPWFDAATFLNWFAHTFQPKTYLEVGVRRGRSMAQVLVESPATRAFGFDMWIPGYGSVPSQGIHTTNPGPDFVQAELRKLGVANPPTLIVGDSHQTLPKFFANPDSPRQFDLIFIDGDHTCEGAKLDLDLAFAHLAPGGALVFDDIDNPSHLDLRDLWRECQAKFPDHLFIEHHHGAGTGVAFRPPFDVLQRRTGFQSVPAANDDGSLKPQLQAGCLTDNQGQAGSLSCVDATQPLVSVIVSAYAAEKYIRACLEDLVAQTIFDQVEVIVIDSGSPQNERAIVEEFQKQHPNICYNRTERETLYAAWNRAIDLARGKYIANANCDDAHRSDALEKLAAALEAHPEADLAYGDYYTSTVPNDSFAHPHILRHVVHPPYHPATVMMYCVTGCHPMWRKTVFEKVGLFDPTYTAPGDWEFLCRFVQAGLRAVHVPQPLSLFFQNPDGLSWKSAAQSKNENDRLLGQHRGQMPIERLYAVSPSDAAAVSRAWTALGNVAMQHEVPWFSNYVQDLPFARVCYEQALRADSTNEAARQNFVVADLLRRQLQGETAGLDQLPAKLAVALREKLICGQLPLAAVEVPPAVEPLTFGATEEWQQAPPSHVAPAAAISSTGLNLPVRFSGAFYGEGELAEDALGLALPLARKVSLATFDHAEAGSPPVPQNSLPASALDTLKVTQSRFHFSLGGIGISHGPASQMTHASGAVYHIGRCLFAAEGLPADWMKVCNQMDEIWVPGRFSAEMFAAAGVERDKLVVIPGAVDAREFDPAKHQPLPLRNRAAFNFLGVFEWRARKGWDVLLSAYLREFSASDDVCLHLQTRVPKKSAAQSREIIEKDIRELARSLKLGDKKLPRIELITEPLSLPDRPKLYRAVDCVVSPSRGEAWGRVAHEAMMMGLPVIATNWGGHTDLLSAETAYPLYFELGHATNLELDEWQYYGGRWANPSEKHLRELMRHIQRHPAEARAKGEKAREHVRKHFSSEVVGELMLQRLRAIEESLTKFTIPSLRSNGRTPNLQPAISNRQSLTVALEGSFLDFGSLSHVNRELSRQLAKQPKLSLACVGKNIVPPELAGQRMLIETARRLKYPAPKNAQVTIRHAWPPNWERPASGKWVLIQPWEFGVLPRDWAGRLSEVDEIWAPSDYVRRVYVQSGVDPRKVHVVPNGIDPEQFRPDAPPMKLATRKKLKFLFVGGTIHRKGPDALLKAYLENFTAADDVCLVIKDFGGQSVYAGQTFESQIRAAQSQPNAPEILYLNEDLAPDALPGLYTACDCLVHPYRGEGFGLPVLEAMACGLPVIVTGGGSTDDFATDEFAYRLPSLKKHFGQKVGDLKLLRSGWLLEPDQAALGERMKSVAANPTEAKSKGLAASEHVRREWTWERAAQIAAHRLQTLVAQGEDNFAPPPRSSKPIALPSCAAVGHLGEARSSFAAGKIEPAWNAAIEAIAKRPFHPEAFLMLAEIAQSAGDTKQAKELAERARRMAPKWKPAQQFLKSPPAKGAKKIDLPPLPDAIRNTQRAARLSVCLITKNEERFLDQCLASVRGLAQQIVVVDTGSMDQTRDIAARHGTEIYSFDWCDDFSAARNAVLERATGDWVLFLDADEELLPDQRDKLLRLLEDKSAIAFRLPMIDKGREDEGLSHVPRLFRNAPGLFHVGRVHEQVFSSVEVRRSEWGLENKIGDATLLHHGYTKELVRSRDKIARNLRLLQKALDELPGEPNLLMNLGLELVRAGRADDGLEQYGAAFRAICALPAAEVTPELRETLLTQYCTHLLTAKDYAKVARVLNSPLARNGGLTASMHWLRGLAAIESKDFAEGAEQMKQCLAKRGKPVLSPINKNILGAGPHHCLASCLAVLKQPDAATRAFLAALEADPKSRIVRFDFARFLAESGQEVEALKWLHQLVTDNPSDATFWLFGGQVALSKPEFLEFACDWTGEAVKIFPAHAGIIEQHATALLLGGRVDEAHPLWEQLGAGINASHRAALLICRTVLSQPLPASTRETGARVNQEFINWYRRLIGARSERVVFAVNQRLDVLRRFVPGAVQLIEKAMCEAGTL